MRSIKWAAACLAVAAFAASLGISSAKAEDLTAELALSPKDHRYNTKACRGLREEAKNYNDSVFNQKPEVYALAAVAPGGSVGLLIYVHQKRELFKTKVQQACMTNPPGGAAPEAAPAAKAPARTATKKVRRQPKAQ